MKKNIYAIFLLLAIIVYFEFYIFNFLLFPEKYINQISYYSSKYNVDTSLVKSIIKTESNYNKDALSKSGACGLMQIMPQTGEWISEKLNKENYNLFDAETNIEFGCYYLNYLSNKYQDLDMVICSYNAGENTAKNWLNDGDIDINLISYNETKNYLFKVNYYYKIYKMKQNVFNV